MFTPVVDISHNQSDVDFRVMRSRGVAGVIIRATHGQTLDTRFAQHVGRARDAGYADTDLGVYTFINPKRGTPAQCAATTVAAIIDVMGHTNSFYMIDVEDYQQQGPRIGEAPVFGAEFASYLREHINAVRLLAPGMNIIAYTNAGYWDAPVAGAAKGTRWVGDATLAGELEWIVPRYHVQPRKEIMSNADLLRAWQLQNAPPEPKDWSTWALTIKASVSGPNPPNGATWLGWQFSAQFNGQGTVYGVNPSPKNPHPDLDLNIIRTEAWERWTKAGTITLVTEVLAPGPDVLFRGEGLRPGEQRVSKNGATTLVHQTDGDVVLRKGGTVVFATNTAGRPSAALIMQDDGNLVLYDIAGAPLWNSKTQGNAGAGLRVENAGKLIVFSTAMRPLWSSDSAPIENGGDPPPRRTATVRAGDGWIMIARRELGDPSRWRVLAKLNGGETRVLHPGDIVVLP